MSIPNLSSPEIRPGTVAVLGVPFDKNSSFRQGPERAPSRIREGLFSFSTNLFTENGVNLEASKRWKDIGDLDLSDSSSAFTKIEKSIEGLLMEEMRVVTLGGDHSISFPIVRAYGRKYPNLNILQLDAHPDLWDELEGNRYSHACPFARIMEEGLATRLVQVGIRTMTDHQREQADRFGVEVIDMKNIGTISELAFIGDVYLSLDLDCLDPAFAPGVSHHEPGGMSTRLVLQLIQELKGNLVGADIVEFNPDRDPLGITAMVAAKLLKEIIGRMLEE